MTGGRFVNRPYTPSVGCADTSPGGGGMNKEINARSALR